MVLVEARGGPRGRGWWGAAIMAARVSLCSARMCKGPGQGQGNHSVSRRGRLSFDCKGTCGFGCSHRSGEWEGRGRAAEGARRTGVCAPRASTQPGVELQEEAQRAAPIKTY